MIRRLFKRKCKHEYVRTHISNVIQYDDLGYPLRLCIFECKHCKSSKQEWYDTVERDADQILKWRGLTI